VSLMARFKRLFRRHEGAVQRNIDVELHFHLDMKAQDLENEALSAAEARDEALRRFGDVDEVSSQCLAIQSAVSRQRSRRRIVDSTLQDLHFAIRALRRRPGFALAAVLTLALGIGANAAMFGVIKTVILAPLPYEDPDRVVQVWDRPLAGSPAQRLTLSRANFLDYKNGNEVFSLFGAVRRNDVYAEHDSSFELVKGIHLSADVFDMMGVTAARGRTFRAEEDLLESAGVVLLTHGYWLRGFGGEEVVGQTIRLAIWVQLPERGPGNGWQTKEFEIVGVLPPDFRVPPLRLRGDYRVWTEPEVVLPLGQFTWGRLDRDMYPLVTLAQLLEGVTAEQARANLQTIAAGIAENHPDTEAGLEVTVIPVGELLRQQYGLALNALWAATALVLLVACSSVSSLLLGWGVAREQELAVRAALGAGARRIFSQLLTEAAVLAAAAGVLGVLFAHWGIAALKIFAPAGVHRLDEASLGPGVLGFTLGVSLATVMLVGLWPALQGARHRSTEVLKAGTRGATLARTRSLRVLVTAEVALSLLLLAGAGLMLQSFWNLVGVDTGMAGEQVVQVTIQRPPPALSSYPGEEGFAQVFDLMRDRVEAIPGVTSFALTQLVPLSGAEAWAGPITIPGRPRSPAGEQPQTVWWFVSVGYFRTLGIRLVEGRAWERDYHSHEDPNRRLMPVVINEAMARTLWPGESALGKFFFPNWVDPDGASGLLAAWQHAPEDQLPDAK